LKKRFCIVLGLAATVAAVAVGYMYVGRCRFPAVSQVVFDREMKSPGCNVILISIDTLRADHLGCYGYARETTPNIDRFRRDAVLFRQAIAHAPSTEPSHASMFTGLIPAHHGALFVPRRPIATNVATMGEILKAEGYHTISYNGGGQVAAAFGFGRGFDEYVSFPNVNRYVEQTFSGKVKLMIEWLNKNRDKKFFFFLHTYETHHPYTPQKEDLALFESGYAGTLPAEISVDLLRQINSGERALDAADRAHIVNCYDAEIYSVDRAFGVLVKFLKDRGLYHNTIIIFTSDHGEEFGEHGKMGWHSHTLYDELLHVPLIVKFKDSQFAGQVVTPQVRHIDLLPTLLDVLDIPGSDPFEGVSLIEWFAHPRKQTLFAVSERDSKQAVNPLSIRTAQWKLYIGDRKPRLYSLRSDPGEQDNVYDWLRTKVRRTLHTELAARLENRAYAPQGKTVEFDKETLERLRSLGYVK